MTRRLLAAALILGAAAALFRGRLPFTRYIVDGPSMEPGFHEGDRLLVNRWAYLRRAPAPGDAVVLRDPEMPGRLLLKRIASTPPDEEPGRYFVLGDNPAASRDSRHFGPVAADAIIGKAWRTY